MEHKQHDTQDNLKEVAMLFLKLGIIGFGGPAAHIAMMQDEVVTRRKWITQAHFLDLIGATNLIPGPNSTEMTMHCGHERAGCRGLMVAGMCFILPAVIITATLAWAYQTYGSLPVIAPYLKGVKPAIIAVVASAVVTLGKSAFKTTGNWAAGIACIVACMAGLNEIAVLFGAGGLGMLYQWYKGRRQMGAMSIVPFAVATVPMGKIFWIFLKIGAILYGSGYVLFSFLDNELVANGLLTRKVLIDAIAIGQVTPGPVFSAATFIGWQIGGLPGAVAATVGIFLPSFVFVAAVKPLIPVLRKSQIMSAFLNTVNVASIAIILWTCAGMGRDSLQDWTSVLIGAAAFVVIMRFKKVNSAFVVLGGAVASALLHAVLGM